MSSPPAAEAAIPGRRRRSLLPDRRSRSADAFLERIFKDHHQELYRYCLAIVRSPADAEDALQATMSAAVRSLPGEEREIAIRPWLYRVAHNEAVSIIRRRRESPSEQDFTDPGASSAAEQLEDRERLRTLVSDLQALPDRQRSALVMRELSGLSYAEIALTLRCGEGAARQVVYEARSALATAAEGREMECDQARQAISAGDRRRLRGRKLKAHLGSCEPCRNFRVAIETRQRDLQALCPPVGVAAASGLLAALVGGAGSGGGLGAGSAAAGAGGVAAGAGAGATGLAGGAAVKGASLVAAAAIAAGAADISGVAELPGPLHIGERDAEIVAPAEAEPAAPGADSATGAGTTGAGGAAKAGASGKAKGNSKGATDKPQSKGGKNQGKSKGGGSGSKDDGAAPGNSGSAPGQQPATSAPGNSGGSNAGGNPAAPGGGKSGSPTPTPGPPATTPATPNAGNGGSGATGPPPNSNAGGQGKGNGTPGGGKAE